MIYAAWMFIGFLSLVGGGYAIGGAGVAMIIFGCGMITAGYLGIKNNAANPS